MHRMVGGTTRPSNRLRQLETCTGLLVVIGLLLAHSTPSLAKKPEDEFLRARESALLLKVVGLSDNIPIVGQGGEEAVARMQPLLPYFVLRDQGERYWVSDRQEGGGVRGFVDHREVAIWNTREGLHFQNSVFLTDRRPTVAAWDTEERIRRYAETGNLDDFGPTFSEELETKVSSQGIVPYPLLQTKEIEVVGGHRKRIHEVLIPAVLQGGVETDLSVEEVQAVAGAVTICVVFDATGSMAVYAKELADTIDSILGGLAIDTSLAAAGFVLFRDVDAKSKRFEVAHPMPLERASSWLRKRTESMKGGDDAAEPVLDAAVLAQNSFLWNGGSAVRGAKRIAIVVANTDAKPETIALSKSVPDGLGATEVADLLLHNGISVFALQAGPQDEGHLTEVLSTLAIGTGGEFYPYEIDSEQISESFSVNLATLVSRPIHEGSAKVQRIKASITAREQGGAIIPLNVLDEEVLARLQGRASEFHISGGGLIVTKAWVFDNPDLYREKILIDKPVLEWLVRFFNVMTDSTLDATSLRSSMANLLEALTGEILEEGVEMQELLEKRLGLHFTTNLLSFEAEYLASLNPKDRLLLQERIRDATGALGDFLEANTRRFSNEPRLWMPVSYLP